MPVIANSPRVLVHDMGSEDLHRVASTPTPPHSPLLRILVAAKRSALIRELAEGADPGASSELTLLASQLTSDRSRKRLAGTWRRTIAEAHQPARTRARVVIIRRGAVLEAQDVLRAMIERLTGPQPVSA